MGLFTRTAQGEENLWNRVSNLVWRSKSAAENTRTANYGWRDALQLSPAQGGVSLIAVSYTHLTLPTILLV